MIDTHHEHRGIGRRRRYNNLFGSSTKMGLKTIFLYSTFHCLFFNLCNLVKWLCFTCAFSIVVKTPVDSTTYSAPALDHGISVGFILKWWQFTVNWNLIPSLSVTRHLILLLENVDFMTIDHQHSSFLSDVSFKPSMSGIIFKHVNLQNVIFS